MPVTVDLYGHGHSKAPTAKQAYAPQSYINELEKLRCEIGAQQWFVCGYSLGAGITIRYTHQHAESVFAHIFTNSSSAFADSDQLDKWQRDAAANTARLIDGGLAAVRRIPVHPRFAKRLPTDLYTMLNEDAERLSATARIRWGSPPQTPTYATLPLITHGRRYCATGNWKSASLPIKFGQRSI